MRLKEASKTQGFRIAQVLTLLPGQSRDIKDHTGKGFPLEVTHYQTSGGLPMAMENKDSKGI